MSVTLLQDNYIYTQPFSHQQTLLFGSFALIRRGQLGFSKIRTIQCRVLPSINVTKHCQHIYRWSVIQSTKTQRWRKAPLGFEPRISCLLDRCFDQLSHRASFKHLFNYLLYIRFMWNRAISRVCLTLYQRKHTNINFIQKEKFQHLRHIFVNVRFKIDF